MSFDRAHAMISRLLREASRCATCGKSTIVLVVPRRRGHRGHEPERVTAATHCTCQGGPAQPIVGKTDADFLRGAAQGTAQ